MYDENVDIPANARTSNLNEELGQIRYLMTGEFLILIKLNITFR
jgi:hypothetical protein